jgi:hydrogenase nickel incorporation protein HypB
MPEIHSASAESSRKTGHAHEHSHAHAYAHEHLAHGHPHAHSHEPQAQHRLGQSLDIEQSILAKNDRLAAQNRIFFESGGVFAINMMSSPGAGKTTLIEQTILRLLPRQVFVIEGDQATSRDAERIRKAGARAVQVNTGAGCHLDAHMILHAAEGLHALEGSMLIIENVGNLVCPALFDLGEQSRVVVLSVTEGEDKPLKYPHMFRSSDVLLLNKIDLLPYVEFDVERAIAYAKRVNPRLEIMQVSATRGDGMSAWCEFLLKSLGAISPLPTDAAQARTKGSYEARP